MKLRAMIAQFEDTRDLRLMGGYHRGADPELDNAIDLVPKIYEVMKQSLSDAASTDAFQEIARAFTSPTQGRRRKGGGTQPNLVDQDFFAPPRTSSFGT